MLSSFSKVSVPNTSKSPLLHVLCCAAPGVDPVVGIKMVNEGAIDEQFVGQHLLYLAEGRETPRLNYWLREGKSANAEVDYAIARRARIVPVEVKAGTSGTLRSLHQFALAKGTRLAVRFDLNPPTVQSIRHQVSGTRQSVEMTLLSLPLYLVGQLGRLLDRLRQER